MLPVHRDEIQHNFLIDVFGSYDESYVPIWGGYWSDYSGCAWMIILDRDGQLYEQSYCYSPESNENEPAWHPCSISYEHALDLLVEWEDRLE